MRLSRRNAVATLTAALLAAGAITACGGDTVALDPVAEAATKTGAAKSMRLELTMIMTAPEFGSEPVTIAAKGVSVGERSAMTMRLPAAQGVDLGEIETRSDGFVIYMRFPFLQEAAPQLKPWIKVDLREAGKDLGIDFVALLELGTQTDPTKALEFLRAAGEVDELGSATIRGSETTHYKGVVDLNRYADQLEAKSGSEAAARSLRKAIELTGESTMPIELWIDEDSLVRRMTWAQTTVAVEGQPPTMVAATMDLFDYGADVDVVIPPDNQTTSFEELQKLGEGS